MAARPGRRRLDVGSEVRRRGGPTQARSWSANAKDALERDRGAVCAIRSLSQRCGSLRRAGRRGGGPHRTIWLVLLNTCVPAFTPAPAPLPQRLGRVAATATPSSSVPSPTAIGDLLDERLRGSSRRSCASTPRSGPTSWITVPGVACGVIVDENRGRRDRRAVEQHFDVDSAKQRQPYRTAPPHGVRYCSVHDIVTLARGAGTFSATRRPSHVEGRIQT